MLVAFDTAGFVGAVPLTGAAVRTLQLNAALVDAGHEVHLVLCDLNPRSTPSSSWPFPVTYVRPADYFDTSASGVPLRLAREIAADVIVCSNSELVGALSRSTSTLPVVYEMHDDESHLYKSLGVDNPTTRAAIRMQRDAVKSASLVVTFTDRDRRAALGMGGRNVAVVPCGTTSDGPIDAARGYSPTDVAELAFVGNMYYEPNQLAVKLMWDELVLRSTRTDYTVNLIGRAPEGFISSFLGDRRFRYVGPVELLRDSLSRTTIGLAPLFAGSGMKLKVLDYMGAGLAVVASREALAGIAEADEFASILDRPGGLLESVGRLIDDEPRRAALGARAHELASTTYSWRAVSERAVEAYRAAADTIPSALPPLENQSSSTPFWLHEFNERATRNKAQSGDVASELARQASEAVAANLALDTVLEGYDNRSSVWLGPDAVVKVFNRNGIDRRHRESLGLRLAGSVNADYTVPSVLAESDKRSPLQWIVMSRVQDFTPLNGSSAASEIMGTVARELHSLDYSVDARIPAAKVWKEQVLQDIAYRSGLAQAFNSSASHLRDCDHAFIHGDYSTRNVGEANGQPVALDFERSGIGCPIRDLASFYFYDVLEGELELEPFLDAYQSGNRTVDLVHLQAHTLRLCFWIQSWAWDVEPRLASAASGRAIELSRDL